jgi:aminomethyltransferase
MLDLPTVTAGPPKPSRILTPRDLARRSGHERYEIPGGGALLVDLDQGDKITVLNPEGGQEAELLAATARGQIDGAVIGVRMDQTGQGLRALIQAGGPGMARLHQGLARRGIDLTTARSLRLFGPDTRAGTTADFTATEKGFLILAAPGAAMDPSGQATLTPLILQIQRADPAWAALHDLPEPLADPLADIRVASATARAYHVKAGDYIQIIDVDGRQCTDFQCFSARKLDRGLQRPLDVTTSRTLMGHAYSSPGLHAKYYDQDWEPLVEVIQDTVGRHDAFAMACAAKYYDDIGYPGHANCSDNFNAALTPHGVEQRPGWMAVNFFFNTAIDAHGVLVADEPWSRPGDYVLLRALTDLVCVNSSCPDDTSPANGWYLSDIHIRIYDGAEPFQRSVAYRPTPEAAPRMTQETAFHPETSALTRNFSEYRGYWLANSYANQSPLEEYWACRQKAAMIDLSPLRKFEITGPDAEALMQWVLTRDVKRLAVGQVVYSAMCYPHGGMIDDGTLFRLGRDQFRWIGGDDYGGVWLREQAEKLGLQVMVRSSTDQLHNIAVQGPDSREILGRIIWTAPVQTAVAELGWFRFTVARLGDANGPPLVVSRTG